MAYGYRIALMFVALLSLAQVWAYYYYGLTSGSDRCHFPDECMLTYYPDAFAALGQLWFLTVVVAWFLVGWAALLPNARGSVLRTVAAGGACFLSLFLTPVYQGRNASGWLNDARPIGESAWSLLGAVLLLVAVGLYGLELLARSRSPVSLDAGRSWPVTS